MKKPENAALTHPIVMTPPPDWIVESSTESLQEMLAKNGGTEDWQAALVEWFRRNPWEWFTFAHDMPLQPRQVEAEKLTRSHPLIDGAEDCLFGGARGPGKSHWALCHLVTMCELYPGNKALMVRTSHPLLQAAVEWLDAVVGESTTFRGAPIKQYTFPNKSVLELRFINDTNMADFKSFSYGVVALEEMTEIPRMAAKSLLAVCRAPHGTKHVTPHTIGTTNPDGIEHLSVKEAYVSKVLPSGEADPDGPPGPKIVWTPIDKNGDGPPLVHPSRVFVPGLMSDNEIMMAKDPGYRNRVLSAAQGPEQRRAWEAGDWDTVASPGALWARSDIEHLHLSRVPDIDILIIGLDPSFSASGDEAGIILVGVGGKPLDAPRDDSPSLGANAAELIEYSPEDIAQMFSDAALEEWLSKNQTSAADRGNEMPAQFEEWPHVYVFGDFSAQGIPTTWMPTVAWLADYGAEVVWESNMVGGVIRPLLPPGAICREARARSSGKAGVSSKKARASTIRGFYTPVVDIATGTTLRPRLVHHVISDGTPCDIPTSRLDRLENQMTTWNFDEPPRKYSPDRIDGLGWAIIDALGEVMLRTQELPQSGAALLGKPNPTQAAQS